MTREQRPTIEEIEEELSRRETVRKYKNAFKITIGILIVTAAVAVLIATLVMPVLKVKGGSMSPLLDDGEVVLVLKKSKFESGEPAAFYYNNKVLIKRVIAGAGDTVIIDDEGNVFVNDKKLDEPYAVDKDEGECDIEFPFKVPEGCWFVLGDHRSTSVDSRSKRVGCIKQEDMIGRILFRIYPFKQISFIG